MPNSSAGELNVSLIDDGNVDNCNDDSINSTVYLIFVVLFFVFGLLGNSFILLAVALEPKLRTLGYAFTVNSAISDCFVLILADVFIVSGVATEGRFLRHNWTLCELSSSFCLSVCICSIWSHTAGSFHSYIRVCHRLRYHKIFNRKVVSVVILLIWLGSQLVVFPTVIGWGGHAYNDFLKYCIPDHLASPSYTFFFLVVGIFLPLTITSFSFVRIGYDVCIARKRVLGTRVAPMLIQNAWLMVRQKPSKLPPSINTKDARLIRSFLFIAVYLFSAWAFLVVIMVFGDKRSFTPVQITCAMTIAHTHCSMNGILYAATNKDFRQTYARICRSVCWCKWDDANSTVMRLDSNQDKSPNSDERKSGVSRVSTVMQGGNISQEVDGDSTFSNCLV